MAQSAIFRHEMYFCRHRNHSVLEKSNSFKNTDKQKERRETFRIWYLFCKQPAMNFFFQMLLVSIIINLCIAQSPISNPTAAPSTTPTSHPTTNPTQIPSFRPTATPTTRPHHSRRPRAPPTHRPHHKGAHRTGRTFNPFHIHRGGW